MKKRRGNKPIKPEVAIKEAIKMAYDKAEGWKVADTNTNLEPSPTRLDKMMDNLETEMNRVIAKMKEMF